MDELPGSLVDFPPIRIAIIGNMTGVGKSEVTNQILGKRCSPSGFNSTPITQVPISFVANVTMSFFKVTGRHTNGRDVALPNIDGIDQVYSSLVLSLSHYTSPTSNQDSWICSRRPTMMV